MTSIPDGAPRASILVVDDTPANLRLLHQMLARSGYEVRLAPGGEAALRAIDEELPDLVLLDVVMPRMDGFAVCRALQQDPRTAGIPVLFISALSETEDKIRAFAEGGVDYITKPFQSEEVLARVRTHLDLLHSRRAMQQLNQRLERSNRELEQFASVAAHDIKAPLQQILGYADLLALSSGSRLDGQAREYLTRMRQGVTHLSTLIDHLLAYSRISTRPLPFQPVDLGALIERVLGELDARVTELGATVVIGELPRVRGDETQLWQLLTNLVGNALKFHKPGEPPHVEIACSVDGEQVVISVIDRGIGIAPKHREQIFELFRRLRPDDAVEGTGIGLAVCKKIVQRHGGTIEVDGAPGEGTTFRFRLPLMDADAG